MSANLRLLANKSFLGFIGFRTSMVLGFQVVGTIAHWQVYAITRDSIFIGYLALTEVVPAIALSLLGGYWADSFNRRKVALIGSSITLLSITILVSGAAANEPSSILPLFIAVAIIGVGRGDRRQHRAARRNRRPAVLCPCRRIQFHRLAHGADHRTCNGWYTL
ncbi:MAG TPA: hypothetical protein PKD60_07165 [Turneriella sp.]|nr:hypothetical protein [Turneriella sp.]